MIYYFILGWGIFFEMMLRVTIRHIFTTFFQRCYRRRSRRRSYFGLWVVTRKVVHLAPVASTQDSCLGTLQYFFYSLLVASVFEAGISTDMDLLISWDWSLFSAMDIWFGYGYGFTDDILGGLRAAGKLYVVSISATLVLDLGLGFKLYIQEG